MNIMIREAQHVGFRKNVRTCFNRIRNWLNLHVFVCHRGIRSRSGSFSSEFPNSGNEFASAQVNQTVPPGQIVNEITTDITTDNTTNNTTDNTTNNTTDNSLIRNHSETFEETQNNNERQEASQNNNNSPVIQVVERRSESPLQLITTNGVTNNLYFPDEDALEELDGLLVGIQAIKKKAEYVFEIINDTSRRVDLKKEELNLKKEELTEKSGDESGDEIYTQVSDTLRACTYEIQEVLRSAQDNEKKLVQTLFACKKGQKLDRNLHDYIKEAKETERKLVSLMRQISDINSQVCRLPFYSDTNKNESVIHEKSVTFESLFIQKLIEEKTFDDQLKEKIEAPLQRAYSLSKLIKETNYRCIRLLTDAEPLLRGLE